MLEDELPKLRMFSVNAVIIPKTKMVHKEKKPI